jgi:RNA polymerase sigma-70 factor (ECF subfamily)
VGKSGVIYRWIDNDTILDLSDDPGEKQSRCIRSKNENILILSYCEKYSSQRGVIFATFSIFPLYYNLKMSSTDERSLARRVLQGDRDAFGEVVHRHQQAVFNASYHVLGNVHDAEDATQEAFIRAYQFFDKFDIDRPLAPWLIRIAINVCLNRVEGQKSASALDEESTLLPDLSRGPELQTIIRDRDEIVRYELNRLPARYRIVIELRHFQGLSYVEFAKELKRPLSDIKSDLFRARKLLAERLRDLG